MGFAPEELGKTIQMAGVVVPKSWDHSGAATEFALATHDEQHLLLVAGAVFFDPGRFLHQLVEVTGETCLGQKGEAGLLVKGIKAIVRKPRRTLSALSSPVGGGNQPQS